MSIRYRVHERFSKGWADARGCFGTTDSAAKPVFRYPPSLDLIDELNTIPYDTLQMLWLARFGDRAVAICTLYEDSFYYALAWKWWKTRLLEIVDNGDEVFAVPVLTNGNHWE